MFSNRRNLSNGLVVALWLAAPAAYADETTVPAGAAVSVSQSQAQITDYCTAQHLSAGACSPGVWWEVKGSCPAPRKVAAVSCALDDLDGDPRLINNDVGPQRTTAACVWGFTNLKQSDAPMGTITLLCAKP